MLPSVSGCVGTFTVGVVGVVVVVGSVVGVDCVGRVAGVLLLKTPAAARIAMKTARPATARIATCVVVSARRR